MTDPVIPLEIWMPYHITEMHYSKILTGVMPNSVQKYYQIPYKRTKIINVWGEAKYKLLAKKVSKEISYLIEGVEK